MITDMIETEWQHFVATYAFQPTRLYLGRCEHALYRDTAEQFEPRADGVTVRRRWRDIPIYLVDADHFIGFGLDCTPNCMEVAREPQTAEACGV